MIEYNNKVHCARCGRDLNAWSYTSTMTTICAKCHDHDPNILKE